MLTNPKPSSCKAKGCNNTFIKYRSFEKYCVDCATVAGLEKLAKKKRQEAAKEKKADNAKRKELTSISVFEKRAERAVNSYVRERDRHLGCVSCDKPANWDGQWHASHFRSVGAASAVRYNLWNIHKSCWICNKLYSGRIDQYEPVLVQRIGQKRVDWLKSQNQITRYSREWLERVARIFNKKTKRLKART